MQSGFFVFCFLLCFFLSFLGGIIVQDENECAGNSVIVGIPPPAICLFHRRSDLTVHCVEMSVLLVFFFPLQDKCHGRGNLANHIAVPPPSVGS